MTKAVHTRNWRARKAEAGLCIRCGRVAPEAPYTKCRPCLDRDKASVKKNRDKRLSLGLCGKCGGERDRDDLTTCATCRERYIVQVWGIARASSCAACGSTDNLRIDHDHDTGAIRGTLCHGCNVALGFANDDPARLVGLANYLLRHSLGTEHWR